MEMQYYQREAVSTDQTEGRNREEAGAAVLVPLLGLAGETGELLTEYKKHLRDGASHRLYADRMREELGDLLWYITVVASRFGLTLEAVAEANLDKIRARWAGLTTGINFDEGYPPAQVIPRRFVVDIREESSGGKIKSHVTVDGVPFGDPLTDNAKEPDGYRFHDVLHFAHAAVLGWSPVIRGFLGRKRRRDRVTDEVEDGGRAIAIEEGLTAYVFSYAREHAFLDGMPMLDYGVLRTVKAMTQDLEVSARSAGDWENAIVQGYAAWRCVMKQGGGRLAADLDARTLTALSDDPATPS